MSIKIKKSQCSSCGSTTKAISRRYKEKAFCSTCYNREFKSAECPKCKELARLPIFDKTALCKACESDKPCIRCGKEKYHTAKITIHGPVCPSCAIYFRELKICPTCGNESRVLSRSKYLKHNLAVCIKCKRASHNICPSCKRYRQLIDTGNGELSCKKCISKPDTKCKSCSKKIPAGRGSECDDCYRKRLIKKRTQINLAAIRSKKIREVFTDYVDWISNNLNLVRVSTKVNKDFLFFSKLDEIWGYVPNYETLLSYFNPEGLRKFRGVITWMNFTKLIKVDENLKSLHSEKHQIERLLLQLEANSLSSNLAHGYYKKLNKKLERGKISLRSIRLTLSSAISLLGKLDDSHQLLTQHHIDNYLSEKPGQQANITGFISFINNQHDSYLNTKIDSPAIAKRRKKILQKTLINMIKSPQTGKKHKEKWIYNALLYYHSLPIKLARIISKKTPVINSDDSLTLEHDKVMYYLPKATSTMNKSDTKS